MVAPLAPDVALVHAALADRDGNLAISEPLLEGVWGAWAARRGVVATVEAIVDDLEGLGHRVRIPAHRVLAAVEAPFGAHPGGCYTPALPVAGYGEDIPFWIDAAAAARGDFDAWAGEHLLGPPDHAAYLRHLGDDRLIGLRLLADPESWRRDAEATPVPVDEPVSDWEVAASLAAREVVATVAEHRADAVSAGAGVANLAAWAAVARAGQPRGGSTSPPSSGCGGTPPRRPIPTSSTTASSPGPPSWPMPPPCWAWWSGGRERPRSGASARQLDQHGNLNSTLLGDGRILVGSGGANDVVSRAAACVVVTLGRPRRLPATAAYITAPGAVTSVVTDRGVLRRHRRTPPGGRGALGARPASTRGCGRWWPPAGGSRTSSPT